MRVLAVNAGSASIKVSLHEATATAVQRIDDWSEAVTDGGYAAALDQILDAMAPATLAGVEAAGHRIVNGGPHAAPVALDAAVRAAIAEAEQLAPLHNHAALEALDAAARRLPSLPMAAVFDTGFHASMPPVAARYALPPELAEEHAIRRFGYHGIAHQSMLEQYAAAVGRRPGDVSLITLQLGGGASACAIERGRSIDTTMGFTPLEGLMMGTRSGSLDPAVASYLQRRLGYTVDEVDALLNERSGLLGVSGRTGDVAELLRLEAQGDRRSALALEMFCYRVRQCIGAYLAVVEPEAIVFGGGIGEHAPEIRRRIVEPLRRFGMRLDAAANGALRGGAGRIDDGGTIAVWVIAPDEAAIIARETRRVLAGRR